MGRHFRDVMGEHGELLAGVLAGSSRRRQTRREVGDDSLRIIVGTAALVADSAGRPIGAVQVDRDITRECSLEARLNHREKLADIGRMAAGLVHEIRKPLNGIKGFASLLGRRVDESETHQRYAASIMEAADRLNGMLGRLLDFARPQALHSVPFDLRGQAERVAEFVRAEDPAAPAAVRVDVPDDARAAVGDPDKIIQVLLNLVKNGVEALDGAGSVCVRARAEGGDGEWVRVEVVDDGMGIAPEALPKLTEPFFSSKPDGTGLGLSIVNRILQLHGTELEIQSRPGRGTTMSFRLPGGPAWEEL